MGKTLRAMKTWTLSGHTQPCPIALTASLLSGRWRTNVLWFIWTGKNRFNQLARELPHVNRGVLLRVLRGLESDGLISRHAQGPRPAAVEYQLTALGHSLGDIMAQLATWGRAHAAQRSITLPPAS